MPRGINLYDEADIQKRLWSPIVLNPGFWLDAADVSTIVVSTEVSQWSDKSGNNRHFTQATAAEQPIYSPSAFFGRAGIIFDGTNDTLLRTGMQSIINNTTHGIYYVMQRIGGGSGDAYRPDIGCIGTGGTGVNVGALHYIKTDNRGASYPYFNTGGNYDNAAAGYESNKPYIFAFQSNTTGWGVWRNGTLEATTSALGSPSTAGDGYSLARQFTPNRASSIVISEVIFVQNVNQNTRRLIEGYLAWKWGLVSNLLANHLYANRPPLIGDN